MTKEFTIMLQLDGESSDVTSGIECIIKKKHKNIPQKALYNHMSPKRPMSPCCFHCVPTV